MLFLRHVVELLRCNEFCRCLCVSGYVRCLLECLLASHVLTGSHHALTTKHVFPPPPVPRTTIGAHNDHLDMPSCHCSSLESKNVKTLQLLLLSVLITMNQTIGSFGDVCSEKLACRLNEQKCEYKLFDIKFIKCGRKIDDKIVHRESQPFNDVFSF